ncbi:MAG: helix-turn-helix domain-containing protein [Alphaproteobacteria bacterium]|nr:helix-turn-helix domain-containing protein [Alphaproteobacteria bacterium]MBU2229925.1 helix-turn-helix domain-containing protein [Alphaproteobacteria bacterium]
MKTIRKVGEILRCFSATQPEHSVTELSRAIGNSISGTHDLVDALSRIGLLHKTGRGKYRLGPLVASLYRALEDSSPLAEAARPIMARLAADHGETLHLTQHDHGRLLLVEAIEGTRPLRVSRDVVGPWLALHQGPPGLLHLAGFSHAPLEAWLDEHSRPGGPIASRSRFRSDLINIDQEGFTFGPIGDGGEIICVAARVLDHTGRPVAVLSMAVPANRHDRQPRAFRNVTVEAAERISARLGYKKPSS